MTQLERGRQVLVRGVFRSPLCFELALHERSGVQPWITDCPRCVMRSPPLPKNAAAHQAVLMENAVA